MQDPAYDQTDYRGREDDGGETSATWIASTNTDWTEDFNHTFRLRLAITETNGVSDNNVAFQLQYNHNSAGWNNVTTSSSVVQATTSSNFSDGDATTQQITSGTYAAGEMAEDGVAGEVNALIDFAGNDISECEWMLDFVDADVADTDTVQFRAVQSDGTLLAAYTNTPTVTVTTSQTASVTVVSTTASSAVSPTAQETTTLSGTCTLSGSAVSGAVVYVVDTVNDAVLAETTSDSNGDWSASVQVGQTVHVAAQYDDGTDKWNEYSKPFLTT